MTLTPIYQTPDSYLLTAIQAVQSAGSGITDFTTGSGARTLYEGLAAALSQQSGVADQLQHDSYLSTATGDALDAKAADYQVTRNVAIQAAGTIRITRADPASTTAVMIPAGWSPLLTKPVSGQQPVAVITLQDAVFPASVLTHIDVQAQAVEGGTLGNLATSITLLPQNPVAGFDTDGDFATQIAFTGGVDEESDDALRARIPIEVAGRVKGTPAALLAAALRVPGVQSANVLLAGDTRESPGDGGTISAGHCEVYYEGDSSLQTQIESEVEAARVAGQNVSVLQATAVDLVVDLTVFCLAGVDHTALSAAVRAVVLESANAVGINQVVRASQEAATVHGVADVISVAIPFTDLRKSTATDNTAGDVDCGNVAYPRLIDANLAVTVTDLA